jgi:hypothetical protein
VLLNYLQGQFYTDPYPSVWLTCGICWLFEEMLAFSFNILLCVCVCVCMYIYIMYEYVCMYVHYVCIYIMYACMCTYVGMCIMHLCIHVTYPHARTPKYNFSCFFVGVKLSYLPERQIMR